ncbi:ATP-dependent helicase [Comamonas antarctica]|uniref:ATP-dependent helicase n=1 Tax=Comamonas antarctica TaxID=2743470 RepID=UPI0028EAA77D|nr:ATP-dependent helicase [Comamonas antarctica]
MSKRYVPRPYQPGMTAHILRLARCNVFASMGSGKTPATMEALANLLVFGVVRRVLVIGPKRVAGTTWPEVITDFPGSFGWITMAVALGSEKQRHAAVRAGAMVTTINFENVDWLVDNYGEDWPFDMVVVDESTKLRGLRVSIQTHKKSGKKFLAGQGASRAKALARVAHTRVKRFVNLTGTPTLAGLEALWGPTWFLDAGFRLGNSFTDFSRRWFRSVPGSSPQQTVIEPMPFSEAQIRNAIQDITLVVDVKDYFDIAEPLERIVHVDLPATARRQYDEMARELATEIDGQLIEAVSAGAKSQKLLQIASGAAYTDDQGNWVTAHDEKIEALKSVVEEAGGAPVLVFYHFKSDLARILKAFPKARVLDSKPQTQKDWNDGKIGLLAAHPAGAGHGLNLQHGSNICCFFSTNWSAENDAQAIERIGPTRQKQSGYDRAVFVYRLVARGTVEEQAVARLKSRVSVQAALLEALKKYQTDCANS